MLQELLQKRNLPDIWSKDANNWDLRRGEIKELLQWEVYGYLPEAPQKIL